MGLIRTLLPILLPMRRKHKMLFFRPLFSAAVLAVSLCLCPAASASTVTIASVFGDHMVLQRDQKVPVWGHASAGDKIQVTLRSEGKAHNQKLSEATADKSGQWQALLAPSAAGGPYTLEISLKQDGHTSSVAQLHDLLFGDVWLCSGQSNMGFTLKTAKTGKADIAQSAEPKLRLLHVEQVPSVSEQQELTSSPKWQLCGPDTVANFSAVGYYFGRDLQKHLGVPVGLIQSSVGGTAAECWMSRDALRAFPEFDPLVEKIEAEAHDPEVARQRYERELAAYEKKRASVAGTTATAGHKPAPEGHPRRPTVLYNGMIAPLVPYSLKGVIWYQGESNSSRAEQYRRLFPALIKDWRNQWQAPKLPFLFVQLPSFHAKQTAPGEDNWAELREAQLETFRTVPNTGMAITIDTGDPKNIHPIDKEPVGARLALAARGVAYGEKLEWSGPLFTTATISGSTVTLSFDHIGSGLSIRDGSASLRGFAIAGADRKFVWADAQIDPNGKKVRVSSAQVANPVAVRYCWAGNPDGNLQNKNGLPASPFRTDQWPGLTDGNTIDSAPPVY